MRNIYLPLLAAITVFSSSFRPQSALTITSTAFKADGNVPSKYSCEGADVNPPLQITGLPKGTKSVAIIMHDPDAPMQGGFTHWVVWNASITGHIPENYKAGQQGQNGAHQAGYKGMCPPSGTHHYHFMVYALDQELNLSLKTDKAGLEKAMHGHILANGEIVGLYKKMK